MVFLFPETSFMPNNINNTTPKKIRRLFFFFLIKSLQLKITMEYSKCLFAFWQRSMIYITSSPENTYSKLSKWAVSPAVPY